MGTVTLHPTLPTDSQVGSGDLFLLPSSPPPPASGLSTVSDSLQFSAISKMINPAFPTLSLHYHPPPHKTKVELNDI